MRLRLVILFITSIVITSTVSAKKTVEYIRNDNLTVVKPDYIGNPFIGNKFVRDTVEKRKDSFGRILKWKFSSNPQAKEKKQDTFRLKTITDTSFLHSTNNVMVWFGHSSFYVRINGVTLMLDPVFYNIPMNKRLAKIPCNPQDVKVDYVLLSHNHRDHFDRKSVKQLVVNNSQLQVITPLRLGSEHIQKITPHYIGMGWYQKYNLKNNVEVIFLPAQHWTRSGVNDQNTTLWGSYIIKTPEVTIYFAGDTGWGEHFENIAGIFPDIDYAIMPIGAYSPRWFMAKEHINPQEVVAAAKILNAKKIIPMHYATFSLSDEPIGEPQRLFLEYCKQENMNGLTPDVGEVIEF